MVCPFLSETVSNTVSVSPDLLASPYLNDNITYILNRYWDPRVLASQTPEEVPVLKKKNPKISLAKSKKATVLNTH